MNDNSGLGRSKANQFAKQDVSLAEAFRALGHPARIAILRALAERGECVCGEIVQVLPLAQSTVSQHLKQLRECGLIVGQVEGKSSCYCVNKAMLSEFFALFSAFEGEIGQGIEALGACCS